jgi:two-component system, OmpR family, response regulator
MMRLGEGYKPQSQMNTDFWVWACQEGSRLGLLRPRSRTPVPGFSLWNRRSGVGRQTRRGLNPPKSFGTSKNPCSSVKSVVPSFAFRDRAIPAESPNEICGSKFGFEGGAIPTESPMVLNSVFISQEEICYSPVFPMRILVVEDDDKIASFVVNGLKQSGFAVDRAKDGEQALDFGLSISYDAAVLDLMLPKQDGLAVLRQLRQKKVSLPVLILSARAGVEDRVLGLQSGGDDYLTKPFAFSELLARVQALIRRATHSPEPSHLSVADLKMDLFTREVIRSGQKIELQSREFALLELLLRNGGRPVTKTMILEHVWDFSFDPQTNVVDVLVHRLRSKVDRGFQQRLIHTVRGVGYVIRAT